jgi:nitrate/TMAO reductase-like tetraheme cytochrome c subunit
MKAMTHTLYLVVAAIVMLITAVVVLVIFQLGVQPAVGLTGASSICQTEATMSCAAYGKMPPTWNIQNRKVVDKDGVTRDMSCAQIMEDMDCSGCEEKNFKCEPRG